MRPIVFMLLGFTTLVTACGVHNDMTVPTSFPFSVCRIKTFGWSRSLGLAQEVWVTLDPKASLQDVVDLSIFGSLRPGMSDKEAIQIMGLPSRTTSDRWGETWLSYDRPAGTLTLGCSYESSGDIPDGCTWRLEASTSQSQNDRLFHPELLRFMSIARRVPDEVEWRALHIHTASKEQFVTFYFDGQQRGELVWHDLNARSFRRGKPKVQS